MNPAALAVVFALTGNARVDVSPFPAGDHPAEMRVTLRPARAPGHVSVRIESQGHSCVLDASRSPGGALAFSTPATCPVDVARPDARGHVDARLLSGRGAIRGNRLSLELRFEVSGAIAARVSRSSFTVLGMEVALPGGWTPAAPIRGTVTSSASGTRQRS